MHKVILSILLLVMVVAGGSTLTSASPDASVDATVNAPAEAEQVVTEDPIDYGKELYDAVKSKDYWYAVGLFLCLLTWGFRKYVAKDVKWFQGSRGGVAAMGISVFLATFALALVAGTAPSAQLFYSVMMAAVVAMGGYTGLRRLVWPKK